MPFKYYGLDEKLNLIGDLVEDVLQEGHGIGYEIGVWAGETSAYLLNRFQELQYRGVDPYLSFEDCGLHENYNKVSEGIVHKLWFQNQASADSVYDIACKTYEPFGKRAQLIRKKSLDAVTDIPSDSLDFVYIDGNHFHKEVLLDITMWKNKIRPRGILIGDDFNWNDDLSNVARAVQECFGYEYGVMADTWFWKKK